MGNIDEKIKDIVSTLRALEYGSLVITVHDGEIIQIDTTEKKRYTLNKKDSRKI